MAGVVVTVGSETIHSPHVRYKIEFWKFSDPSVFGKPRSSGVAFSIYFPALLDLTSHNLGSFL
jgi:hypothetical protein